MEICDKIWDYENGAGNRNTWGYVVKIMEMCEKKWDYENGAGLRFYQNCSQHIPTYFDYPPHFHNPILFYTFPLFSTRDMLRTVLIESEARLRM